MGCTICDLIRHGEQTLWENENFVIVFNRYPYKFGHLMIIPKCHTDRLSGLSQAERTTMIEIVSEVSDQLVGFLETDSVNHGINQGPCSGASLPEHIHYHLVPRKHNDVGFFTIIGRESSFRHTDQDRFQIFEEFSEKLSEALSEWGSTNSVAPTEMK